MVRPLPDVQAARHRRQGVEPHVRNGPRGAPLPRRALWLPGHAEQPAIQGIADGAYITEDRRWDRVRDWREWWQGKPLRRGRPDSETRIDAADECRHWLEEHGHKYGSARSLSHALENHVLGAYRGVEVYSSTWLWLAYFVAQVAMWWWRNRNETSVNPESPGRDDA